MKIPLYKRRIERSAKPAGAVSNLSVNTAAWMAPGQAVAKVGNDLEKWAFEKAEMEAKTEASNAVRLLNTEVDALNRQLINDPDPFKADRRANTEFKKLYEKAYQSKGLSNKRSKGLFQSKAEAIWRTKLSSFRTKNDKRIIEHRKGALTQTGTDLVLSASDLNAAPMARMQSFINLTGRPGVAGHYSSNDAKMLFTAEQLKIRKEKVHEDVFRNISAQLMSKEMYPTDLVSNLDNLLKKDQILAAAARKLPAGKLLKIQADLMKKATAFETAQRNDAEAAEARVESANKDKYQQIINLPDTEEARATKRRLIKELKEDNWLTQDQLKFTNKVIKDMDAPAGSQFFRSEDEGSRPDTLFALEQLERIDKLTRQDLINARPFLTRKDYKDAETLWTKDREDGQARAIADFKNGFRYVEALAKTVSRQYEILGDAPDAAFRRAKTAMSAYLNANPNASYDDIIKKGREIAKEQSQVFVTILGPQKEKSINNYAEQNKSKIRAKNYTEAQFKANPIPILEKIILGAPRGAETTKIAARGLIRKLKLYDELMTGAYQ